MPVAEQIRWRMPDNCSCRCVFQAIPPLERPPAGFTAEPCRLAMAVSFVPSESGAVRIRPVTLIAGVWLFLV